MTGKPEDQAWSLDQSAAIADHWQELIDAAEAGDERARAFLATFGPWAKEQLDRLPKS